MKKILKNPIGPKGKTDGVYPFEFKAPSYDNRTSRSISAGDDYGVGFRTPVGKENAGSMESGPLPQASHCFTPYDVLKNDIKG